MDWLFGDIPPAGKSALTGGLGVFAWFLIQLWRAWRDHQKEKSPHTGPREVARQGRLDAGFTALEEIRNRDMRRLDDEIDTMRRRYIDEIEAIRRRADQDLARSERLNDLKRSEIERLARDRDEGWNLARGMEVVAHQTRHDGNNRIMAAYAAGKNGAPCPDELPLIPPLHAVPRTPPQ